MRGKTIVILLAAVSSHSICAGEIYRCSGADGNVMYTNLACPADSRVQRVASYEPVPSSPVPAWDASAAQLAAAASARQAQEAAAQAQAAAYQSAQAAYRAAEADAESDERSNDYANYPTWIVPYPVFASRSSRRDGHHHQSVVNVSGSAMQPHHRLVPPASVNLLARHR